MQIFAGDICLYENFYYLRNNEITKSKTKMIKVTLGEVKPQPIKDFPKLMICDGRIGYFLEYGKCIWLHGAYAGEYVEGVHMEGVIDYNEPITIQNA